MRRPMPPELLVLGDHLETATRRQIGGRRARRQQVLNALASIAVAVPLALTTVQAARTPVTSDAAVVPAARPSFGHKGNDSPPRLLRRVGQPNDDVLYDDTTLRRALR